MSQCKFQLSKIQLLFHRYSKIFTIQIYNGVLTNFLLEPQGVFGIFPNGYSGFLTKGKLNFFE